MHNFALCKERYKLSNDSGHSWWLVCGGKDFAVVRNLSQSLMAQIIP